MGVSTGLSIGVGSWVTSTLSPTAVCRGWRGRGVDGRTSSIGSGASLSIPRPTVSVASLWGIGGTSLCPAARCSARRCFSARRSSFLFNCSSSCLLFASFRLLSLSNICLKAPASNVSAKSSILLVLLAFFLCAAASSSFSFWYPSRGDMGEVRVPGA